MSNYGVRKENRGSRYQGDDADFVVSNNHSEGSRDLGAVGYGAGRECTDNNGYIEHSN